MKKTSIILALLAIASFTKATAQGGEFSAKAGLNIVSVSVDFGSSFGFDGSASSSQTGFYVGGGYKMSLSDTFAIEPALLFSIANGANAIYLPIMAQYSFSDSFYAQAGPQVNYLLEDVEDGALGIDIAAGGGYNINDTWYVEARYGFEVFRGGDYGEITSINTLTLGAGYRF